jgi:hypothetical protein
MKPSSRNLTIAFTLVIAAGSFLHAQLPPGLDAAIGAIFDRSEYSAESVGTTAWLDGGRRYTQITRGRERSLVAYDTATGTT